MNIYNKLLIILIIFCTIVNSNGTKARKGVPLAPNSTTITAPPSPSVGDDIINSNKTNNETIKTTLKPKVIDSTNVETNTHKGREGIIEEKYKLALNKTITNVVDNKNKTINNNSNAVPLDVSKNHNEQSTTLKPIGKVNETIKNSTIDNATTTTVKTTIKLTTTTTTTPKPIKPKASLSVEDFPSIANVAQNKKTNIVTENSKLPIDEPIAQSSREIESEHFYTNRRHDYFIAIVSMIFILPLLMGIIIVAYRKFNDFWSTRHYRRMDFLIEGMYD